MGPRRTPLRRNLAPGAGMRTHSLPPVMQLLLVHCQLLRRPHARRARVPRARPLGRARRAASPVTAVSKEPRLKSAAWQAHARGGALADDRPALGTLPSEAATLIQACWQHDPATRPTALECVRHLIQVLPACLAQGGWRAELAEGAEALRVCKPFQACQLRRRVAGLKAAQGSGQLVLCPPPTTARLRLAAWVPPL